MHEPETVVLTGASGFLGQALAEVIPSQWPGAKIISLVSPRHGGVDLAGTEAGRALARLEIGDASRTVLIHAAASVVWNELAGLFDNARMAAHVAEWAREREVGFSVLVSGVNVYAGGAAADVGTSCEPDTLYGLGKLTAEHLWRISLSRRQAATVRLAGLWGWQKRPTLFWNRLLLAAVGHRTSDRLVINRCRSRRNYISAPAAAACICMIGAHRIAGVHLCAGRDTVETETYVRRLSEQPGAALEVEWRDDGKEDAQVYLPSQSVRDWLPSFEQELEGLWVSRPGWVGGDAS